jgi:hypothetical protein
MIADGLVLIIETPLRAITKMQIDYVQAYSDPGEAVLSITKC